MHTDFIVDPEILAVLVTSERWSHGATGGQASGLVGWEGADGEQRWGKKYGEATGYGCQSFPLWRWVMLTEADWVTFTLLCGVQNIQY